MSWEKEALLRGQEYTPTDSTKAWGGGGEEEEVHEMEERETPEEKGKKHYRSVKGQAAMENIPEWEE